MNSLSNNNKKDCFQHCPPQYCEFPEHVELHPVGGSSLLQIGSGNTPTITSTNVLGITTTSPLVLAQITVDPTSLCFPNLKLEFSTLATFTASVAAASSYTIGITLQLSRISNNYTPIPTKEVLAIYPLSFVLTNPTATVAPITLTSTLPISLVYAEEDIKPIKAGYVFEIISVTGITAATTANTLGFQNTYIAGLTVGGSRLG